MGRTTQIIMAADESTWREDARETNNIDPLTPNSARNIRTRVSHPVASEFPLPCAISPGVDPTSAMCSIDRGRRGPRSRRLLYAGRSRAIGTQMGRPDAANRCPRRRSISQTEEVVGGFFAHAPARWRFSRISETTYREISNI